MLCRLLLVLVFCALLAESSPLRAETASSGKWMRVGEFVIEPRDETVHLKLETLSNRVHALRLFLPKDRITLNRVVVSYGNGQVHFEDRKILLKYWREN